MGTVPSFKEILHARIVAAPWRPHVVSIFSKKSTHHYVHELGNGVNERPDPFSMGLCVNGAVGCADKRTPWALLRVDLKEVERPEQMLWVPTPWSELVTNDELPDELADSFTCSEVLAKEPGLRGGPAPISS